MTMLDDATAVVYSHDDLDTAVSDINVDYIYFGANIELTGGITVNPAKETLAIDGTYEGVRYTFTDHNSSSSVQTLGIRSASGITLTIKNIDLIGRNYYGIPYVSTVAGTESVTVVYENVYYTGVQIIYHQRGLTRFIDCDIRIAGGTSTGYQEVGEVCKVEIGGNTSILKENEFHAVFWVHGASNRVPYLKILSGATVTIETGNYILYENYPPQFIIEPDASLTMHTASGITFDGGHSLSSFLVDERASFYFTQTSASAPSTVNINGTLTVNEGASFYMQTDFNNSYPIIRFNSSSAGMNINNPKSFVLFNRGTSTNAKAFGFSYPADFVFTGGQLNLWDTGRTFPVAGTFDDRPQYKWHRPEFEGFTISGTATSTATTNVDTSLTPEELADLPPLTDMQPRLAQVFSIGNLPLTVDSVIAGRVITGTTEPLANVKAEYSAGGAGYMSSDIAHDDGSFAILPLPVIPFGEVVTTSANTPFLIVWRESFAQEDGVLEILEAPLEIELIIQPIATDPDVILPRRNPYEPVLVSDTRADSTPWILWASVSGRLESPEGHYLTDAVVFADEQGGITPLSTDTPMEVYRGEARVDTDPLTEVFWENDKGILGRIREAVYSGERYSTRLIWEVTPVD